MYHGPMDSPRRLRILLYLLITAALVLVMTRERPILPFRPPDATRRLAAAGDLSGLPERMRRAFSPGNDFAPIPEPKPGEWLTIHDEAGQTYDEFAAEGPVSPNAARRYFYLQPVGRFGPDDVAAGSLEVFIEAFFDIECRVLPALRTNEVKVSTRINEFTGKLQLHAGRILAELRSRRPADGFCLVAVTLEDLYPRNDWNYVFGLASLTNRVGVYSFARFDPAFFGAVRPPDWMTIRLRRSLKLLAHEAAHVYGLPHCIYYDCLENGCNSQRESDRTPLRLCPVCLRKLQRAAGFDVVRRYERLRDLYRAWGLAGEADWTDRRLARIRPGANAPTDPPAR